MLYKYRYRSKNCYFQWSFIRKGATAFIKFTPTYTHTSLNINNTGADSNKVSINFWNDGEVVGFIYDDDE